MPDTLPVPGPVPGPAPGPAPGPVPGPPPASPTVRWQSDRTQPESPGPNPPDARPGFFTAVGRGLLCKCPNCGKAPAFQGYLTVVPECPVCRAPLGAVRADDAPPYFTIFIVGHLLVPIMFWHDYHYNPPIWVLAAVWLPLTALACLLLLRPIKGATLGLMLRVGLMKPAGGE